MRILILCHAAMGGSGIMATELGLSLAEAGHEVHILSDQCPFRLQDACQQSLAVHFHHVSVPTYPVLPHDPYVLALADAAADVIDQFAIDVVHVHYLVPLLPAAALACQMVAKRPRLVATMHGTDVSSLGADSSLRRSLSWSLRQADVITAVSGWLAELGQRTFALPQRPLTVGNSVDPAIFHAGDRSSYEHEPVTLLHVSNFRPVKRTADVIRAFAEVRGQAWPDAALVMVGDGPDLPKVQQLAHELGVFAAIEWVGRQAHVAPFYRRAHLLLQPSESEACPLTVLEAYACGCPAVGTRVGGLTELLRLGSGLAVPVGRPEMLADATMAILGDRRRWQQMSQQVQRVVRDQFTPRRVVAAYERIFAENRIGVKD